jgi:DNA polymerase IIIc chi subunit
MKTPEINFYQVDETIVKSLAPLLLKVLEEGKKALVFCSSQKQVNEIDNALWSYGRNKFIPHLTIFDEDFVREFSKKISFERQPILISDKEENSNQADYLVFLDEPTNSFISSFQRVFYFYEASNFAIAKVLAQKLSPKNSYKKIDGKWVKDVF